MTRTASAPPTPATIRLVANTIRTLSLDAIEAANSGHPGLPLGGADFAAVLLMRHLRADPSQPDWPGRDRFVLSAGHGSMLLYSMLHLAGYDLPLDEIRRFRQWESRTPGHPEYGMTPGVETTTGPLGQGLANAVGMALAERHLAARHPGNPDGPDGHRTFCFVGDGCLMEGVAAEAVSLAGHWKLGRLVAWYDSNDITIDGSTDITFTEDVGARFAACGWHVVGPIDGHDPEEIHAAIERATAETGRPTLIIGRTTIAKGSPKFEGTSRAHGAPLGADEVRVVKQALGFDPEATFVVPEEVTNWFAGWREEQARETVAWEERRAAWAKASPAEAGAWEAALADRIPADPLAGVPAWKAGEVVPTRKAGQTALQAAAAQVPWLMGGSADLFGSNLTRIEDSDLVAAEAWGNRCLEFGVREHAMGAIVNGLVLHGGVRAFGSTFLVFSDYFRPSIRLAALMNLPAIHVLTHDSVWVGEDGPTHQPVEHVDVLRAIPGTHVIRPCDARETAEAWRHALRRTDGPTLLVLTRQGVPVFDAVSGFPCPGMARVVSEPTSGPPAVILVSSGSEVSLCEDAVEGLAADGIAARVVSIPCREAFLEAPAGDQDRLLPPGTPRLFVEAGPGHSWAPLRAGSDGFHGIDRFGVSAPGAEVAYRLGLNAEAVRDRARGLMGA